MVCCTLYSASHTLISLHTQYTCILAPAKEYVRVWFVSKMKWQATQPTISFPWNRSISKQCNMQPVISSNSWYIAKTTTTMAQIIIILGHKQKQNPALLWSNKPALNSSYQAWGISCRYIIRYQVEEVHIRSYCWN